MNKQDWNTIIGNLPSPQLLQTWEWGEVKSKYGWNPYHRVWHDDGGEVAAAAMVLERTLGVRGMAPRLRILYTPKGPLLRDWGDTALRKRVIDDLITYGRQRGAFLLKIDADVPVGYGEPGAEDAEEGFVGTDMIRELKASGWRYSNEQVQYRNTVLLDLDESEEDILAGMKQKTRYNIRLAGRKGVTVRQGTAVDFDGLYKMYAKTAVRDGFAIRGQEYYLTVWKTFFEADMLTPLIAEVSGEPVAGLMLFHFGGVAWYLFGMSRQVHREKMPNYQLQWEAIRTAKQKGCRMYDLWGAPGVFDESDSLWGVYRFKRGLGGKVARHIGAWDLPLRPWIYKLYTQTWPRVMDIMRLRGRGRTRHEAGGI